MAKACAVRGIQTLPDGQIVVEYTYGTPPVGSVATGAVSYFSEEKLKQKIGDIEQMLGEEGLMLLHLAITYLKPDGTFNNVNQVLNKTVTLDPFAAQPLRVT